MLLWPIINIFFVVLVGYDSDVTKAIRELRQKHWRSISSSGVDLTRIQSITRPNIKSNSTPSGNLEPESQIECLENDNQPGEIDLSHIERWQSSLYSQTVLDEEENRDSSRRSSLPNQSANQNVTSTAAGIS